MNIETPWDPASRRSVDAERASTLVPITLSGSGDDLDSAAATSCGVRHDDNEDSHSPLRVGSTLYVVADGVGGGAMASTASRELVADLHDVLDGRRIGAAALRQALRDADRRIGALIAEQTAQVGAATVALCCRAGDSPAEWLLAWVGDCRIYRVAPGAGPAALLSSDDTYALLGEATPRGGSADDPARMVGNGAVGEPNTREVMLAPGELLLLCSDGVHKHVDDTEIADLLRGDGSLAERCARLVSLARSQGSHDDATVLVVQRHVAIQTAVVPRTVALPPPPGPPAAPPAHPARRVLLGLLAAVALAGAAGWYHWRGLDADADAEAPLPAPGPAASAASFSASAADSSAASAAAAAAPASAGLPPRPVGHLRSPASAAAASAPRNSPAMHVEAASAPRRAASRAAAHPARRASEAVRPKGPA